METILDRAYKRIKHMHERPLMYFSHIDYSSASNFVRGFFMGIEESGSLDLNSRFTDWIQKGADQTALTWDNYIFHIKANGDAKKAYDILFETLLEFLKAMSLRSGNE